MEALRALTIGDLPPVGQRIVCSSSELALPYFEGYFSYWVDSGTSALALALLKAKESRSDIASPEVIVPGYCCPDLVSAAHYAGLVPIVVDIQQNDPALNLEEVRLALTENTVAIIAINFLGVAENLTELLDLKAEFPQVCIIEDNAQWFPASAEKNNFLGDFVSFSFGRGKPVSMLGGGLLLSKQKLADEFLAANLSDLNSESGLTSAILKCKYFAYNQLLNPFLYQLISRNPLVSVGQTKYDKLMAISSMGAQRLKLLPTNIKAYGAHVNVAEQYDTLFEKIGFRNEFKSLNALRRGRLLRYPVLFSSVERKNKIFGALVKLGLGATQMYGVELPKVTGVDQIRVVGDLKNAASFASRFITLPVHSGVSKRHIDLVRKVFER